MKRTTINLIVDSASFLVFALMIGSGVVLRFALPRGSGGGREFFGMVRHEWADFHFWVSISLITILAVHLVLHWRWIVCVVRNRLSEPKRKEEKDVQR